MVQYKAKHSSGLVECRYSDELDALVNRFAVFVRDLKSQDKSHHRWTFADMGTAAEINRVAGRYSSRGWEADVVEVDIVGLDEAKWTSLHTQLLEEPSDSRKRPLVTTAVSAC